MAQWRCVLHRTAGFLRLQITRAMWHVGRTLMESTRGVREHAARVSKTSILAGWRTSCRDFWDERDGPGDQHLEHSAAQLEKLIDNKSQFASGAFSPDGRFLAAGAAVPGELPGDPTRRAVFIWDIRTWGEPRSVTFSEGTIASIAFSTDSKTLIFTGTAGRIHGNEAGSSAVNCGSFNLPHWKQLLSQVGSHPGSA